LVTACAIILHVHAYISSFNANPIKLLYFVKYCVLNINMSSQFADTSALD